jgi:uncharacterized membrane protein YkoI
LLLVAPEVFPMKRSIRWVATALATMAAVPLVATAQADEKNHHETPISMDKIPAAARDALTREASGGTIMDVVEENEHGQTVYEAHVRKGNDVIGIEVDANGKVLKRETEPKGGETPKK